MVMLAQSTSAAWDADGAKLNKRRAAIAPVAARQSRSRADLGERQLMMVRFALPPSTCQIAIASHPGDFRLANPPGSPITEAGGLPADRSWSSRTAELAGYS